MTDFFNKHVSDDFGGADVNLVKSIHKGATKKEVADKSIEGFMKAVVQAVESDDVSRLVIGTPEGERINIVVYKSMGEEFDRELIQSVILKKEM